jgi:hypothetical protein
MNYNPFIIPFTTGAIILFAIIIYKLIPWSLKLPKNKGFICVKTFSLLKVLKL